MNKLIERGEFYNDWKYGEHAHFRFAGKVAYMRFLSLIVVQFGLDAIGDRADDFHQARAFSEADAERLVFW